MTSELSIFAARVRDFIAICANEFFSEHRDNPDYGAHADIEFNGLALMLFTLQFGHNPAYRKLCERRNTSPDAVTHWTQIPAVPTSAFKEFEISCLPDGKRTRVFYSSGTTAQEPSRHFHNAESLAVYQDSLLAWFRFHIQPEKNLAILTPPPFRAPNSSLVHMFETVRRDFAASEDSFFGVCESDGSWALNFNRIVERLKRTCDKAERIVMLGTAFSFVHLLDYLAERDLRLKLPTDSLVMETGGYKNRSRVLPRDELHSLVVERMGVPRTRILCEYGMSELSSQAYQQGSGGEEQGRSVTSPYFQFPPWARAQVVSAENGREVNDGDTGLLRIIDLANVFSAMAIETEDLAVRRGGGFELLGRAEMAEPRGCSLMAR